MNCWLEKYLQFLKSTLSVQCIFFIIIILSFKIITAEIITEKKQHDHISRVRICKALRPLPQLCQHAHCIATYCCAVLQSFQHCSKAAMATTLIHLPMAHVKGCRCYIFSGPTPYRWLLPSTICLVFFSGNLFYNLARKAALNQTPVMNWDCTSEKREFKVSFTIFGNTKTSMLSLKWNSIIGILCELWQYAPVNGD